MLFGVSLNEEWGKAWVGFWLVEKNTFCLARFFFGVFF